MELFKAVANSIKDIDAKQRTIVAYASIFGNIDSDDDIIQSGAYTKTIQENGPKGKNRVWHLFNHDTEYPVTKPFNCIVLVYAPDWIMSSSESMLPNIEA